MFFKVVFSASLFRLNQHIPTEMMEGSTEMQTATKTTTGETYKIMIEQNGTCNPSSRDCKKDDSICWEPPSISTFTGVNFPNSNPFNSGQNQTFPLNTNLLVVAVVTAKTNYCYKVESDNHREDYDDAGTPNPVIIVIP